MVLTALIEGRLKRGLSILAWPGLGRLARLGRGRQISDKRRQVRPPP